MVGFIHPGWLAGCGQQGAKIQPKKILFLKKNGWGQKGAKNQQKKMQR